MNAGEPENEPRRRIRDDVGDLVDEFIPKIDPGPILDGLRVADRAIQDAAGSVLGGLGDVIGKGSGAALEAASSVDVGAVASSVMQAAGPVLEAAGDVAGEVLGSALEGLGNVLSS